MKPVRNRTQSLSAAVLLAAAIHALIPLTAWPVEIRLAVVAADRALASEADLLTVALSQETGVTLVERGEINRVVNEQQWTAAGFGECVRLGKLLRADGVIALRSVKVGQQEPLVADLVAVRLGFRLDVFAEAYPAEQLDAWVASVRGRFVPLLPKLVVQPGDAIPVSLLSIRASAGTTEAKVLERSLTFLLEARLVSEPRVFVLERQHLGTLEFDKDFVAGSEPLEWAKARCVVDGELLPFGLNADHVRLRLSLEPPNGHPATAFTVNGSQQHLGGLVDEAAAGIMSAIGQPVLEVDWQPEAEAERYCREAFSADRAGLDGEALAAGEASHALGYRSEELAGLIARQSCRKGLSGRGGLSDGYSRSQVDERTLDIGLVQRALDLANSEMQMDPGSEVRLTAGRVLRYYHEDNRYDENRQQLDTLRASLLSIVARSKVELRSSGDLWFGEFVACYAPYLYDDPQEVLDCYRKLLQQEITGGAYYAIHRMTRLRHYLAVARDKPRMFGTGDLAERTPWLVSWNGESPESLRRMWDAFLEDLSRSNNAEDQLDGLLLRYCSTDDPVTRTAVEGRIRDALWQHREAVGSDIRAYSSAVQLLDVLPGKDEAFCFKLLDYFLQEADFYHWRIFEECLIWVNDNGGFGFTDPGFRSALSQSMDAYGTRMLGVRDFQAAEFVKYRQRVMDGGTTDSPSRAVRVLELRRSWLPQDSEGPWSGSDNVGIRKVIHRDSHLWVLARKQSLSVKTNAAWIRVFQMEPATLNAVALDVPLSVEVIRSGPNDMNFDFEVSPQHVFVVSQGKLLRYDRTARTWDSVDVPDSEFPSLTLLGNRLYYAYPGHMGNWGRDIPESGIIGIDPGTLEQEVLASSRRKQPATVLDDVPPYIVPSLFLGPGGQFHAVVCFEGMRRGEHLKVFQYNAAARDWIKVLADALEGNRGRFGLLAFPQTDGALFQCLNVSSMRADFSLMLYHGDGRVERLIDAAGSKERRAPWIAPEVPWDYSSPAWTPLAATLDGKEYWVLLKDKGGPLALFRYRPGSEQPTMLRLDFAPLKHSVNARSPGLIATPQGLVLTTVAGAAFWIVPWEELTGEKPALGETGDSPGAP